MHVKYITSIRRNTPNPKELSERKSQEKCLYKQFEGHKCDNTNLTHDPKRVSQFLWRAKKKPQAIKEKKNQYEKKARDHEMKTFYSCSL